MTTAHPNPKHEPIGPTTISMPWWQHCLCVLVITWTPLSCWAQFELPATDLWLIRLQAGEVDSQTAPRRLTTHSGYDNQPSFSPSGDTLYFTRGDERGYTDIIALELANNRNQSLTQTPLSEFSALPVPTAGTEFAHTTSGWMLAMVQVQQDGAQWLVGFDPDSGAYARLNEADAVGYHTWLSHRGSLQFIIDEPSRLEFWRYGGEQGQIIASNIGRGLQNDGHGRIYYVTLDDQGSILRQLNEETLQTRELTRLPEARQDFAVAPDGTVWVGIGSRLYHWQAQTHAWRLAADLAASGITDITRLSIAPQGQWLALVSAQ